MNPGTHLVLAHVVVIHVAVLHAVAVHATASRQVCDEVQGDAVPDCDSRALPVHRLILLHVARVLAAILLPRRALGVRAGSDTRLLPAGAIMRIFASGG